MIYAFYNVALDQEILASALSPDDHDGTDNDGLEEFLNISFYCRCARDGTVSQIKRSIDAGNPVLVNFLIPYDHGEVMNPDSSRFVNAEHLPPDIEYSYYDGHYAVIAGYDDAKGVFYIHNPEHSACEEISISDFEKVWMSYYISHVRWMLVVEGVRHKTATMTDLTLTH